VTTAARAQTDFLYEKPRDRYRVSAQKLFRSLRAEVEQIFPVS
jgi:hypothetical protein